MSKRPEPGWKLIIEANTLADLRRITAEAILRLERGETQIGQEVPGGWCGFGRVPCSTGEE